MLKWFSSGKEISPPRLLAMGFAGMITAGTFLLSLPFSTVEGRIDLLDALFTATSAVCVTGLVVVDTGTYFTVFGQMVIMFLILGGALGFMTSAALIFVILGKRITLKERLIIKDALNTESIQGIVLLTINIFRMAMIAILLGSLLLGFRFVPQLGWSKGLLFSIFHSISAFGNAGFDLIGNFQSLTPYAHDYLVSGTILFLFIFGGLGFTVVLNLYQQRKPHQYSLHTKLVLIITSILLLLGTLFILLLEYNNPSTLGPMSTGGKIYAAFFTSATSRTAGFNVIPTDGLRTSALFFLLILMFIGASPASTGGGVKTTTFGLILSAVKAMIKGQQEVVLFEKHIPERYVLKALAIVTVAVFLIFFVVFALTLVEEKPFLHLIFEVFSAFGTVGLSTGITPELSGAGKTMIIATMFIGRIGPLTMLYALTKRLKPKGVRYPEENILIG